MYFKFIFLSLKRSIKTYFIYMITLVICVALFYSFNSLPYKYYRTKFKIWQKLTFTYILNKNINRLLNLSN